MKYGKNQVFFLFFYVYYFNSFVKYLPVEVQVLGAVFKYHKQYFDCFDLINSFLDIFSMLYNYLQKRGKHKLSWKYLIRLTIL